MKLTFELCSKKKYGILIREFLVVKFNKKSNTASKSLMSGISPGFVLLYPWIKFQEYLYACIFSLIERLLCIYLTQFFCIFFKYYSENNDQSLMKNYQLIVIEFFNILRSINKIKLKVIK